MSSTQGSPANTATAQVPKLSAAELAILEELRAHSRALARSAESQLRSSAELMEEAAIWSAGIGQIEAKGLASPGGVLALLLAVSDPFWGKFHSREARLAACRAAFGLPPAPEAGQL